MSVLLVIRSAFRVGGVCFRVAIYICMILKSFVKSADWFA